MIKLEKFFFAFISLIFIFSSVHAQTKVRSASEYDYPPLALVINGKARGFSVDLLKAALKTVNIDVSFYVGPWSQIKNDLAEGKIDVLPLVGRTPERETIYDFSVPYITLYGAVFIKKGVTDIKDIRDLQNKSIVVMKEDNAEEFIRRNKLSENIHTTTTFEEAFLLVSEGKYDAVVTQKIMGIELLKRTGIHNVFPVIEIKEFKQNFTFAVKKGNMELLSKLNDGLSRVITDGTFNKIRSKWFGEKLEKKNSEITKNSDNRKKYFPITRTVSIFIFLILLVILILNKVNIIRFEKNVILLFLTIILILIAGLFVFNAFRTTSNLKNNAVRNYFDTLNATAFTLNTNIKNEIRHNIDLIKSISLQESISNEELQEIAKQNSDFLGIFILDSNGKTIHSSDISQIGLDRSSKSYFLDTKKEGYVKPVYLSKTVGKVVFTLSTPYKDGVLVARMNMAHIQEIVSNVEGLGKSGESLLAYRDENGNAVFFTERKFKTDHKSRNIIPKEDVKIPITQALMGNQSEFSDYTDYRGIPVFAVTKYIKEIDAGLVVKIDREEALKSVSENINDIWYSTTGTISTIIIIFVILYFLLTNALRREIAKKTDEYKKAEGERRKLEEKLLQAQKMEAIGTLAGGIAHDFNNILSPIIGYTELLLSGTQEDDQTRERLNIILHAANRAKSLIQQILSFSRQHRSDKKPTLIQPIINEVLTLLESVLPSTIEITRNIDRNCGKIMGDYTQIHQILMNLCTNAFHAMEKTGGRLSVDLEETETVPDYIITDMDKAESGYALLTVSDTGKGIRKSDIKRIFEPYFTTKDKEKGTGLGLSVVHGIVKEYGGEIAVYSEPGKGTVFKVYIPLLKSSEEEPVLENTLSEKKSGERIMVVDDEEIIISVANEILEYQGYHVTPFKNSQEALQNFKKDPHNFDLIITDKTMPGITGIQLSEEIMNIRKDIPIILCSGFIDFELEKEAIQRGIAAVLKKPVTMKVLSDTVEKVLRYKQ